MSDPEVQRDLLVHRTLGQHGAQIQGVAEDVTEIKADMKTMGAKIDAMLATHNQVKGGWTVLLGAASAAGAVTGFLASALSKMKGL